MKKVRFITLVLAFAALASVSGAAQQMRFVDAYKLNLVGKAFPDTPNPYHRVDTERFQVVEEKITNQYHCPSGMAVLFRTDSRRIDISATWGFVYEAPSTMAMAYRGFDLYIRNGRGEWEYAGSTASRTVKQMSNPQMLLMKDMDGSMHDCMVYLPMYSELLTCRIGVEEGAVLEPLESPFRHKVLFYGSSFTQGVGSSRAGLTYPMQWMRMSGLQVVSVATSGRAMMQPYIVPVLEAAQADAYVLDVFSNPKAPVIRERLIPFIDRMIAAHPGRPIVFQRTIYRERRRFDKELDASEAAKAQVVDSIFNAIKGRREYKDVYLITPTAAERHETSIEGTHPDDRGYTIWARSIEGPLKKIFRKYGIK